MKLKRKRAAAAYLVVCGIFVLELGTLFCNSAIVPGINERAEKLKVYAQAVCEDNTVIPGNIYDRNKKVLVENTREETENAAEKAVYENPLAYSQLLGYTGSREKNVETHVIGERDDYRLMRFLADEDYWGKDKGIYVTAGENGQKGQSAVLTIDDEVQSAVFAALGKEVNCSSEVGSAVVMDARTGEILSMVSFPSYDFNDLTAARKKMNEDEKKKGLEPGYPVSYRNGKAPGSIFKILIACSLLEHGMGNLFVSNTSFTDESGWECKATPYDSGTLKIKENDRINLEEALNVSNNCYFAQAALLLGEEKLQETASAFGLEPGNNHVSTNFGWVMYNWDLDSKTLAQTGIGQGKTEWTTVFAAMVAQAIANNGVMMQPYLVKELIDENQNVVYEAAPEVLRRSVSSSTAQKVTSYLSSAAKEICQVHGLTEAKELVELYRIAGKTGTAEVENGKNIISNNAWFLSYAPADDPKYVVAVNQCQTDKKGYQMVSVTTEIYKYLFEEYEKSE